MAQAVQDEGGTPMVCGSAHEALLAIGQNGICAAILDDGICNIGPQVCNQLDQRGIPYVLHVNLAEVHGTSAPATADAVIHKLAGLLRRTP